MKKLHLTLMFALTIFIGSAFGQKAAVGGATGLNLLIGGGTNIAIPITASGEYAFKDNMSVAANLGYEIGPGFKNFSIFYFSPEFRYHLNKAFNGAYVGGFFGVGAASFGGSYIGLGATAGYQIMITEKFNLDINAQAGWGSAGGRFGRSSGFHLRPTVGFRYAFN